MRKITIEIDSRWAKVVHSPLYWIAAALQGVSIGFAPRFLNWSGKGSSLTALNGLLCRRASQSFFSSGFSICRSVAQSLAN
jgi:hypothetical protein